MKLQTLTVIFIIIILPVVLVLSTYIGYELKTIKKQNMYNTGIAIATHDAIFAFELNTKNDNYSNNAEYKRINVKSAIKTFENSFSKTCNIGVVSSSEIEKYIPAMLFGLYDGFYMYAPSRIDDDSYKHNLRNYVYYSEQIPDTDIVIRYTLDNYVAVSGTFDKTGSGYGTYQTMAGYLIAKTWNDTDKKYNNIEIEKETLSYTKLNETTLEPSPDTINNDNSAQKYYEKANEFTIWFNNMIKNKTSDKTSDVRYISSTNDPEDENSAFVTHKREIIRNKIESTLNSSITAYANISGKEYKMPKLSEEDWEKIYNNISVITFIQGLDLGMKKYNNYCVLNSTNNSEFVNPNLMYFIDDSGVYHDIKCGLLNSSSNINAGYKIGDFATTRYEIQVKEVDGTSKIDGSGNPVMSTKYYYKHNEYACYDCINGGNNRNLGSTYDFINDLNDTDIRKKAYYTSLARERQNTVKLLDDYNK